MLDYKMFLLKQGLSEKTVKEYLAALNRFFNWLNNHVDGAGESQPSFTGMDLIEYRSYLINYCRLVPATINKNLAALRKFLVFQGQRGIWREEVNLMDVRERKITAPKRYSPVELKAILYAIENEKNDFLRARDRCMVSLVLYRGMRIGEELELLLEDVIFTPGKQKIIIRQGKGGKYHELGIHGSEALAALKLWMLLRKEAKFADSPYLFISSRSDKLTYGAVEKMCDRISSRSGLKFTTHRLRHTFISSFLSETNDIRLTSEVARHENIQTTMIYTTPTQENVSLALKATEKNLLK